jgi:hypothetical protein
MVVSGMDMIANAARECLKRIAIIGKRKLPAIGSGIAGIARICSSKDGLSW